MNKKQIIEKMNTKEIIEKASDSGKEYFRIGKDGRIITMSREELGNWQIDEYFAYMEKYGEISQKEFIRYNAGNYGRLSELASCFREDKKNWLDRFDTVVVQMGDEFENRYICVGNADRIRKLARDGAKDIEEETKYCREGRRKLSFRIPKNWISKTEPEQETEGI